jgi:hypothetical protein
VKSRLLTLALLLVSAAGSRAETITREFTLDPGPLARVNAPVRLDLILPRALAAAHAGVTLDGQPLAAQLTAPSLGAAPVALPQEQAARELWFIAPNIAAGATAKVVATISTDPGPAPAATAPVFHWVDKPPVSSDLLFGERLVMRYMREPYDASTKANRERTYKVYHHVFDPETGKIQLTKGPGSLFPHHRGLYYGFQKVTYDGTTKVNIWECPSAWQGDGGTLATEAGPVLGRHRVKIEWHGKGDAVFAVETREVTAFNTAGGLLIEWASHLETTGGLVKLDGDPQHGGFQYRATAELDPERDKLLKPKADADAHIFNSRQTYYLRPDGQGKIGDARDPAKDKRPFNLPWDAMSYLVGEQRYTVGYLDRPQNPKPVRYSERDYGRFGSFFPWQLTKDKPLDLDYRLWVQKGEMSGEQVKALDDDFVNPVIVR